MVTRFYSSIAQQATLTNSITPSTTVIQVSSTAGFPGSTPYTLSLDYGAASEELVDVTGVAGLNLTVTRAVDGTSAISHNAGAVVRHVSSGRDFAEAKTHENAFENVHGLSGGADVVGTSTAQTLSNKTLTRATGTLERIDIFNTGTWVTAVIGDSVNPTISRFHILDNEINLRAMATFISTGGLVFTKDAAEADTVYKLRVTDSDGTTDRFAVLAGGTLALYPTTASADSAFAIKTDETSATEVAIRVADFDGTDPRWTVFKGGNTFIQSTPTTTPPLEVRSPASISVDKLRVTDSAAATDFAIQSTGRMLANNSAVIVNPGDLTATILQVGGSNAGATGDLTQWVDPTNTIVARVRSDGTSEFASESASGATVGAAMTGWALSSAVAVKKAGMVTVAVGVTRTGADIVPSTTPTTIGNIADSPIFDLTATWSPDAGLSQPMIGSISDGIILGGCRLNSDGTIDFTSWREGVTIASGAGNIYRCHFTFPI